jgi:hypothetical protein
MANDDDQVGFLAPDARKVLQGAELEAEREYERERRARELTERRGVLPYPGPEHERIAREQGFTDRDRPENSDDPRVRRPLPIVTNEHTNARDPRSPQMARKLFPDNWRD